MPRRRMNKRFNRIWQDALQPENLIRLDLAKARLVIFSDHHKGDFSSADDFKNNAQLYGQALSYYSQLGFKLIVLGDNEELWENTYGQILPHYRELIKKEIDLALESQPGRKIRVWGNHDKEVILRGFKKDLKKNTDEILQDVDYREGLCLSGGIFLLHGHQGRFFEDIAWKVSRWAVKFIWKTIQKLFRIGSEGPAENYRVRDDLEKDYYAWAKKNKVLLICGHTHRALFASLTHFDSLQIKLNRLEKAWALSPADEKPSLEKEISRVKKEVEKTLARRSDTVPPSFEKEVQKPVPCYFNDGCCVYTNGITCLEIDRGVISLIKWQLSTGARAVLARGRLSLFLDYIRRGKLIDDNLREKIRIT